MKVSKVLTTDRSLGYFYMKNFSSKPSSRNFRPHMFILGRYKIKEVSSIVTDSIRINK